MGRLIAFALMAGWTLSVSAGEKAKPLPTNPNLKPVTVDDLAWSGDLAAALEQARKEKKLVFIDFTGITCVNCKVNEKTVFIKPEVKDLFKQFVRVQLYTDSVPEKFYKDAPASDNRDKDAETNQNFQRKTFGNEQLPLYVIVKPIEDGGFETIGTYTEGRIRQIEKFIGFLKKPLKQE